MEMDDYEIVHHLIQFADSSLLPQLLLYTLDQVRDSARCRYCLFPDVSLINLITVICVSCTECYIKDKDVNNPLHLACNTALKYCEELIHVHCINEVNGSYQTLPNNNGQLPLHTACEINHKAIQLVSSQPEIDVNTRDRDGSTPLHMLFYR